MIGDCSGLQATPKSVAEVQFLFADLLLNIVTLTAENLFGASIPELNDA
jgi:hypothetical protein